MDIVHAKELLGRNLERLRTELGMEVQELAKVTGISVRRYRRMEAGEIAPRLLTLIRLANALGVDASSFFRE